MLMLETFLNSLLSRCVDWIGSESGGALLFGSGAFAVALIVGWVGVKAIKWTCNRLRGNNLPVRDFVESLLERMGQVGQWIPETVASAGGGGVCSRDSKVSVFPLIVTVAEAGKAPPTDVSKRFNRHEWRRVRESLTLLRKKLFDAKEKEEQQKAEAAVLAALRRDPSVDTIPINPPELPRLKGK